MATFKEWIRDFKKKPKWDRFAIVFAIVIGIIGLIAGGNYLINIGNNNTQIIVEGDNKGQICVDSVCELSNTYNVQAELGVLYDISYKEYELGIKYKEEEDYEKAKEQFLKVIELKVDTSSAWYQLGYLEIYEGGVNEALQNFKNALVGCDEWYIIFNNRKLSHCNSVYASISDIYFYQKDYSESIKWLNKIEDEYIKLEPPLLKFKAQRHMLNGKCNEAKIIYLDFINLTTQVDWQISLGDKALLISESIKEYCFCKYQLNELEPNNACEISEPIEAKFTPNKKGGYTSFVDAPINNSGAFR